jgi:propanediol dehydratase-reactivating factor small subunit
MTQGDDNPDRPAIHVTLAREVDESLYKWISVGAEEEGIPCRLMPADDIDDEIDDETDVAALAHAAARSSRLDVGVGVASGQVAVHERHMPVERPVVATEVEEDHAVHTCRTAGSNAARLVIGMPLRLDGGA